MFRADRLTERRKLHKLTQEQLARLVDLTKAAIGNYEQGRSAPPYETLIVLVDALQTNADYLLGLTDDPEAKTPVKPNSDNHPDSNHPSNDARDRSAISKHQGTLSEPGIYIAYLGGPPEEMDEEEAEHLKRELEMFRAFKEKRRRDREAGGNDPA
ncbi:helix-turn-helix domain-containing protein [Paenibacillus sp. strain BS8-2]